ncbi:MAG: winged helix-turn-helix domain-containing protein [Bacteriovoracia bacterium]
MLDKILGSKTAQKIFLHLYHHEETYPSAVARDFKISLGQVQRQFDRFEECGLIVSRLVGRTRVYQFNYKQGIVKPFIEIVKRVYDSIPVSEKEKIFSTRMRPRRRGKPVKGRQQ